MVLWSKHSIASHWVADEAGEGRDTGRLAPVSLDGSMPPLGFRQFQTIDFSHWSGGEDEAFQRLDAALQRLLTGVATPTESATVTPAGNSRRVPALVAGGVLAAAIVAGGAYFALRASPEKPQGEAATSIAPREGRKEVYASIAVLPFVDMSEGKDQEHFSDGIAEELLNALARNDGLKVAARTSSFLFKGKESSIGEIARALNVETVLEGSVRKSGERLRITAQLIDAETGFHLWSETYDREMTDIFAVQDELSAAIVSQLNKAMRAATVETRPANAEAYEAYLRGKEYLARKSASGFQLAAEELHRALDLDPDYADGYAALGEAYYWIDNWALPGSAKGEARARAAEALQKALSLDPDNHNALFYDAIRREGAGEKGAYFKYAQSYYRSNPSLAEAQFIYGVSLKFRADLKSALAMFEEALATDPLNPDILFYRASSLIDLGRAREAIDGLLAAQDFTRENYRVVRILSDAYGEIGDCPGSFNVVLRALERTPAEESFRLLVSFYLLQFGFYDDVVEISAMPGAELIARIQQGEKVTRAEVEKLEPELGAGPLGYLYLAADEFERARVKFEEEIISVAHLVAPYENLSLTTLLGVAKAQGNTARAGELEADLLSRLSIMRENGYANSIFQNFAAAVAAARGDREGLVKALAAFEAIGSCNTIDKRDPFFAAHADDPGVKAFFMRQDRRIAATHDELIAAGLIDRARAAIAPEASKKRD